MNRADILIAAVVGLSAWHGFRSGLIRTAGGLVALIAGLWAGWRFRLELVYYAENAWGWAGALESWLFEHIPFLRLAQEAAGSLEEASRFESWFDQSKTLFLPRLDASFNPAGQLALILLSAAAFILIFAVTRFVLRQLFYLLQKLADLTPLYVVNHALGCAAGALKGALGSALVLLLLTPFFSTGAFLGWAWSNAVMQTVSDSFCYQLFLGLWRSLRAGWM